MKTDRIACAALSISLGLAAGCDVDATDPDLGEVSLRPGTGSQGGVWLNTSAIGTQAFSEIDLSGALHDDLRFTGLLLARPLGVWLPAVPEVVDGNLQARVGLLTYSGAALVGSRWKLKLVDGGMETPVELVITGHTQISARESRYKFETLEDGVMTNICAPDSSGARQVVPMKDISVDGATGDMKVRPRTLFLACTSGAVGKAIAWGYAPWVLKLKEFEVATRMVRADYCFDGMSWTSNGTSVQVRDKWTINSFLHPDDATEVVWTKQGAACLTQPRSSTYSATQVTCDGQPLPACPGDGGMTAMSGQMLYWTKLGQ